MFPHPQACIRGVCLTATGYPFMEVSTQMAIGEHPAHVLADVYVFTNCESVELRIMEPLWERSFPIVDVSHITPSPVVIDDLIGERLNAGNWLLCP